METLTLTKTKLSASIGGGEPGVIYFQAENAWNNLSEVGFTTRRTDIDNLMLESLTLDKQGIIEDMNGGDFIGFEGGYSFNRYYKSGFDSLGSKAHTEFKKGRKEFFQYLCQEYPDDIDHDWNESEYLKYENATKDSNGYLADLQIDRVYKTFMHTTKENYEKFLSSVKGLTRSPEEFPNSSAMFEYGVTLIRFVKEQPFFLEEWFQNMIKAR